jgi:adenine-specific DNA-methyltransferase
MSKGWASALGLAITPLFAQEQFPEGEHHLLLDGVRGSFGLSYCPELGSNSDTMSWAWSSGVLHHVTITPDLVFLNRWDRSTGELFTLKSVEEKLGNFYDHIAYSQPATNRTIASHAVDSFRRLRSSFTPDEQTGALSVFLLILGAMVQSRETALFENAEEVATAFSLNIETPDFLKRLSPDFVDHFVSGFRRPVFTNHLQAVETLPSLVVRHAGATVFQEAHFELIQRGLPDIFGVPSPASVSTKTESGVHFTPPGLARAIVEQALHAYGPLPSEITILDAACGSGSILYEALRTLRDLGYRGNVKVVGFDESPYAVEMTRFLLSALQHDYPDFHIKSVNIECRDSLDDQPWPVAHIILMNPPFVSLRGLNPPQKKLLVKTLGRFSRGRPDLSMAFVERGLQSLAPNGVLGTLLPAGVLGMTFAEDWRRHLLDEASVSFLAVFAELGLFKLATVETGCVILRKSPNDVRSLYRSLWVGEKKNATPEALRFLRRATQQVVSSGAESDDWTLDDLPAATLLESPNWRPRPRNLRREFDKIESYVPTSAGSLFDIKQGALPAPREVFIISEDEWRQLPLGEQRWFRRIAENENIRAGQILPGSSRIFYPRSKGLPLLEQERLLIEYLPVFGRRLMQYKPSLQKRRGKHDRWWELGEGRKWLRSPSKKIVSSYFGQSGSFAFDAEGDRVVVQGYGWLPRWKVPRRLGINADYIFHAYLAIFNSLFFGELLSEICPTVGGGQLNLSKRYSERVRLPDLLERFETNSNVDIVVRDLSFIGKSIATGGLLLSPRAKAEELVRLLYGV